MFLGLLDDDGRALHPDAAQRVPSEIIQWSMEYAAAGRVQLVNLNVLRIKVYREISAPKFFGWFREVDDVERFAGAFPFNAHYHRSIEPGAIIEIAARGLRFETSFTNQIIFPRR